MGGSMEDTKIFNVFSAGTAQGTQLHNVRVQVCPLVLVAITDAYTRRQEGSSRSIGTLLGNIEGNVITVTDAFSVNHVNNEDEGHAPVIAQEYHRKMLKLKRKVCVKDNVIGWFSTGTDLMPSSVLIHTFYAQSAGFQPTAVLPSPLHLIVDCECNNQKLALKCYTNVARGTADLFQFHPIPAQCLDTHSASCRPRGRPAPSATSIPCL